MPPHPDLDHCHPHHKPHPHPTTPVSPRHQLAVTLTSPLGPIVVPLPPQIKKAEAVAPSISRFIRRHFGIRTGSIVAIRCPGRNYIDATPTIETLRARDQTSIPQRNWNRRPPRPPSIKLSSFQNRGRGHAIPGTRRLGPASQ